MARWYEPLLAFLAAQPPETTRVTLTMEEVVALAAAPIPDSAYARQYWWQRRGARPPDRLWAAGWRVASMHEWVETTITFVRLPPDTTA